MLSDNSLFPHDATPTLERTSLDLLATHQPSSQHSLAYHEHLGNTTTSAELLNIPSRPSDPLNPAFYGIGSQFGSPAHPDLEAGPALSISSQASGAPRKTMFFSFLTRFALACVALGIGATQLVGVDTTVTRVVILCFTVGLAFFTAYHYVRAERTTEESADAVLLVLVTGILLVFLL